MSHISKVELIQCIQDCEAAQAAFAHGQVHVALSRCKSFEGIVYYAPQSPSKAISRQAADDGLRFVTYCLYADILTLYATVHVRTVLNIACTVTAPARMVTILAYTVVISA